MNQSTLIRKPAVRRVFGRVKGVPINLASDSANAPAIMKDHIFELRKDGLWFRKKHSPKWAQVQFGELVLEAKRQRQAALALVARHWEDPRQTRMFEPKKDEQRSLNDPSSATA